MAKAWCVIGSVTPGRPGSRSSSGRKRRWQAAATACGLLFCRASHALTVGEASLRVDLPGSDFRNNAAIMTWIERSAGIVSGYYGRFPVPQPLIHVQAVSGHGVETGTTYGTRGGMIRIVVGRNVTERELLDDWVLIHEMIHLALPDVGPGHAWLSEGLATYVEGIARAQAGNRTPEDVWAEQVRSMPKGLPQSGDAGLDHTHTWGRTYWGGALFCLIADVEIRRQTQNKFGLQDAMRAVARTSGGLATDWPIERVFATGDTAVSTLVLESLYAEWKGTPVSPDLSAFWHSLGIEPDGVTVRLRDDAPLAGVRRAITRRMNEAE